jgi:hypothetical protein
MMVVKNKVSKIYSLVLFFFLICSLGYSQTLNVYDFTSFANPYVPITGGTVLGTATAISGNAASLDKVVYTVTIPFSFKFEYNYYTTANISTNGFMTLGASAPSNQVVTMLDTAISANAVISPMGGDLNGYFITGQPTQCGEIRYETLGASPNRVFVLQYKNMRPWNNTAVYTSAFNFQVRLYETTNNIEFSYGCTGSTFTNIAGNNFQVGLRGINNVFPTNVKNRSVVSGTQTSWLNSVFGSNNKSTCSVAGTLNPSNITFRYAPPSCPAPENLFVSYATKTQATLNWTSLYSAQSFQIEYGAPGFVQGTGTLLNSNTNSITITGLTPQTSYQYYVRQFCGGTSYSAWVGSTFATGKDGEDCATALTINPAASLSACNYTVVSSGTSLNAPDNLCSDSIGKRGDDDTWYKFVAPAGGNKLVITTQAGTVNDWVMELWSDCPGTGSVVKCADDNNGFMPEIQLCQNEYTAGATYYIRIWTYSRNLSGTCGLCIYQTTACALPPANDECATSIYLPINPPQACPANGQIFTNVNSTVSASTTQTCDAVPAGYKDVWFKFNTANYGDLSLTITPITAVGLKAALIFECGGFEIQCFSNANGTFNLTGLNPVADYVLRVWTPATGGTPGTFKICLSDICDAPTATLSGSYVMCAGGTVQAKVDFTGYSPWTFVYSNGTTNTQITTSSNPYYINLSPSTSKTYSLVSVSGPYCSGTVSGSAVVTLVQPATVTLSNLGTVCTNQSKQLSGGSPVGGTYSGNFVQSGSFFGNQSGPGTFNVTYTYSQGPGCARSASNVITAVQAPSITGFAPTTGPVGTDVGISGLNLEGVTSVMFNTTSATQVNVINGNAIHAIVPSGATTGLIKVTSSNGCFTSTTDPYGVGIAAPACYLSLKVFIQGFYYGGQTMAAVPDPANAAGTTDTITVELHSSLAPYDFVVSRKGILSNQGNSTITFPGVYSNNSYYVVVKHRNSIETWSRLPVFLPIGGSSYNFSIPGAVQRVRNQQESGVLKQQ